MLPGRRGATAAHGHIATDWPHRHRPATSAPTERKRMGLLDGKIAIVTGAGRGIGRDEALLLASEGATVIVNDIGGSLQGEGGEAQEVVDTITANGGTAAVNGDDISSWNGAKNLVDQAVDGYGALDIVVNNAGILRDKMSFSMEESTWDDVIRVHLKGHFGTCHFAAAHWRAKAKAGEPTTGRIINTTSESGLFGSTGQINYGSAKLGIVAMTWILARELERFGVTVNAIAPRARTRMTETIFTEMSEVADGFDKFAPSNVAQLVGFLATDEAADVNAQIFVVFGGDIWVMNHFQPVGEVHRDKAWTPQDLIDAKGELFKGIPSGLFPFSFF
jgi:NAD(P)-dependent dehydrogenase (short-subunit alcohol dehydrogenase family)